MKKFLFILFLISIISLVSQAQKPYSMEHLEQVSQEELGVYLNKALKQQKTGRTLNIVGGSILGATAITSVVFADQLEMGVVVLAFFGGLAGIGTMAVGIPMNVTGKKRVERIKALQRTSYNGIKIDLQPCAQYNLAKQNYQPGLAIRITF